MRQKVVFLILISNNFKRILCFIKPSQWSINFYSLERFTFIIKSKNTVSLFPLKHTLNGRVMFLSLLAQILNWLFNFVSSNKSGFCILGTNTKLYVGHVCRNNFCASLQADTEASAPSVSFSMFWMFSWSVMGKWLNLSDSHTYFKSSATSNPECCRISMYL